MGLHQDMQWAIFFEKVIYQVRLPRLGEKDVLLDFLPLWRLYQDVKIFHFDEIALISYEGDV